MEDNYLDEDQNLKLLLQQKITELYQKDNLIIELQQKCQKINEYENIIFDLQSKIQNFQLMFNKLEQYDQNQYKQYQPKLSSIQQLSELTQKDQLKSSMNSYYKNKKQEDQPINQVQNDQTVNKIYNYHKTNQPQSMNMTYTNKKKQFLREIINPLQLQKHKNQRILSALDIGQYFKIKRCYDSFKL